MTIEGELDDISGQADPAAHKLCTGIPERERRHLTVAGAGHHGILKRPPSLAHAGVFRRCARFIAAQLNGAKPPAAKAKKSAKKRFAQSTTKFRHPGVSRDPVFEKNWIYGHRP